MSKTNFFNRAGRPEVHAQGIVDATGPTGHTPVAFGGASLYTQTTAEVQQNAEAGPYERIWVECVARLEHLNSLGRDIEDAEMDWSDEVLLSFPVSVPTSDHEWASMPLIALRTKCWGPDNTLDAALGVADLTLGNEVYDAIAVAG
ncbi:MAG: hypothetical protein AAGJ94_00825 [Pseudomonadota bacterium]